MSVVSTRRAAVRARVFIVSLLALCSALASSGCSRKPPARPPLMPDQYAVAGRAPGIAFDAGGALHLVYVGADERVRHRRLDRNAAIIDSAISPQGDVPDARGEIAPLLTIDGANTLNVVYASKRGGRTGRDLVIQRSSDGGTSWSAPVTVNDDAGSGSHSFASMAPAPHGGIVAAWLDNRSGHQGVRTAHVAATGAVARNVSIDDVTCECCRTALLATSRGELVAAYRDHADGNVRNMLFATSHDDGASWSAPLPIADDHWIVNGCPESGPTLTEAKDGTVWAAWFNGGANAIEVASLQNGRFTAPRILATADARNTMVNHPVIATLPDGRLAVAYEATRTNGAHSIDIRVADALGQQWSAPFAFGSDVTTPRIASARRNAALACTQHSGNETHVLVRDIREVLQ
jgi:hypothetical protein